MTNGGGGRLTIVKEAAVERNRDGASLDRSRANQREIAWRTCLRRYLSDICLTDDSGFADGEQDEITDDAAKTDKHGLCIQQVPR